MRKPEKPCRAPGCPNLTEKAYCREHERQVRKTYEGTHSKIYRKIFWKNMKERVLREEPFCRLCSEESEEVDHIVPLRDGGGNERENLQALCKRCHSKKTAREISFIYYR